MGLEHKNAVGVLHNHHAADSTLNRLEDAGIPLNRITLVARTVDPDDVAISESQFFQHRTIEQLEKGVQEWGIYKVL